MRTDWIEEQAREEGIAKGRAEGREEGRAEARAENILATLDILSNLGISKEVAIQNLKEHFNLTEEKALGYYSKHSAK